MLTNQMAGIMKEHIISLTNIVHERVLINMDLSKLNAYIEGEISGRNFFEEIREEVLNFIECIRSESGSIQIIGSEPGVDEFGTRRMLSLLYKYLDGDIGEWELEYILRVIEFTFDEEDDRVESVIFSFSDPYLNFNINAANVESAIMYLTGCVESMTLHKGKGEKSRVNYQSVFHRKSFSKEE